MSNFSCFDLFQREFNDLLTKLQEKIQQVSLEFSIDSFPIEVTDSQPPIQLLHPENQYCVMKKRDLFPMNEMDIEFSKIIIFSNEYKI